MEETDYDPVAARRAGRWGAILFWCACGAGLVAAIAGGTVLRSSQNGVSPHALAVPAALLALAILLAAAGVLAFLALGNRSGWWVARGWLRAMGIVALILATLAFLIGTFGEPPVT